MGIINVYTGPMKCGKSQKIFNELKRQLIAGKNIKVFKPLLDNRAGDAVISTRAGNSINAINIQSINEYYIFLDFNTLLLVGVPSGFSKDELDFILQKYKIIAKVHF